VAQGIGNDLKADFPCLGGVHANGLGHQRLVRFPGYGLHGVYVCSVRRGVLRGTMEEWGGGGEGEGGLTALHSMTFPSNGLDMIVAWLVLEVMSVCVRCGGSGGWRGQTRALCSC